MTPQKPRKSTPKKAAPSRISERRHSAKRNARVDYATRRQEIIATAAEVFREKGYQAATLNDIAAKLGTDRASLYYYVADKSELFHETIRGVLDDNIVRGEEILASDAAPTAKLDALVAMLLESYEANYPHMFVFIQEDMAKLAATESSWSSEMVTQARRMQEIVRTAITQAVEQGEFRDDITPHLATYALFGMLNWTHRWFEPGKPWSSAEIAESFASIFSRGMTTPEV